MIGLGSDKNGFVEFVVRCLLPSFEERRDLVRFEALSTFRPSGTIVFSPNKNTKFSTIQFENTKYDNKFTKEFNSQK